MSKRIKYREKNKRQNMIDSGAYDGRYATKVVSDKKKKASKNACRRNSKSYQTDF